MTVTKFKTELKNKRIKGVERNANGIYLIRIIYFKKPTTKTSLFFVNEQ